MAMRDKAEALTAEEEEEEEDDEEDVESDKKKKRRRASSSTNGGCHVDNCNADISNAKPYYRRHKVCQHHSKAPLVLVHGIQQRFCQQCSRFHEVSEFDEAKRSCRRRLAGHNQRRRKTSSYESLGERSS